ncbi:hypothetical protein Ocin01_16808 [Orchesella cincta]|uniref:Uncharacterized protein n=1 Tax=Orchesella cincta TaxID=48709 RepID=A0A1D2MAB0_ORCCI|nr:hypothetical protein Ocin01_16808 [Orchesella cincta]
MDLHVEINIVNFPLEEIEMCRHRPKDGPPEKQEWDQARKAQITSQKGQIHMIKIGPITEQFLSKKKLNPALDFLQGVNFTLTDDNDYLWTSGDDLKGLPLHCKYQLLAALLRMGYTDHHGDANRLPWQETEKAQPITKYMYSLTYKY